MLNEIRNTRLFAFTSWLVTSTSKFRRIQPVLLNCAERFFKMNLFWSNTSNQHDSRLLRGWSTGHAAATRCRGQWLPHNITEHFIACFNKKQVLHKSSLVMLHFQ